MIKRKDGRWQEQIKLPGMEKPKYFYGRTQKEVLKKLAEYRGEVERGKLFEECVDEWAAWHEKQVSYNGANAYNAAIKQVKDQFGGRSIKDIKPDEIDAFIRWVAGRGYARRTVQMRLDLLNMAFDYAVVHLWCDSNPCASVSLPKGLHRGRRELPERAQIERIKSGFGLPFGLFACALLYSGLRRGELMGLRWEDIDRQTDTIYVRRSVYFVDNAPHLKAPKTEKGVRQVPLLAPLKAELPEGGAGYLFHMGDDPERLMTKSSVRKRWLAWCKAVGIAHQEGETWRADVTPHQLRHEYATTLYDAGIDVGDAKDMLGHSTEAVTRDIYTHIRQSRRKATAERLNEFLCQEDVRDGGKR